MFFLYDVRSRFEFREGGERFAVERGLVFILGRIRWGFCISGVVIFFVFFMENGVGSLVFLFLIGVLVRVLRGYFLIFK